jgi:hypothetical protein
MHHRNQSNSHLVFVMSDPCDNFEASDYLEAVSPVASAFILITTLASSSRAPYERKATGLSIACAVSFFMWFFSGCSFVKFGDGGFTDVGGRFNETDYCDSGTKGLFAYGIQSSYALDLVTEDDNGGETGFYYMLYSLAPLIDLGVVVLGMMGLYSSTERLAWSVAAFTVGLVHTLGVLAGNLQIDAVVAIAAFVSSGVMEPLGALIDDSLQFLPAWIRVSQPFTHVLFALLLFAGEPLVQDGEDELKFADVLVEPQVVGTFGALAGLTALSMESEDGVKQIASVASAGALIVGLYKGNIRTRNIIDALDDACSYGTMAEVTQTTLDDEDWGYIFSISLAPLFAAAALVLLYVQQHGDFASFLKEKQMTIKGVEEDAKDKHGHAVECESGSDGKVNINITGAADPSRGGVGAIP